MASLRFPTNDSRITFIVKKNVFGHNGVNFFIGVNIMPLNKCPGEVLDNFPELLFSKVFLLLFARCDLKIERV